MAFFLQGNKYHICEDVKGLIGFHVRAYPKMVTEGKSAELNGGAAPQKMAQTRKFAISSLTKSFESLVFDNRNLALLPIDESRNNSSRIVKNAIYSLTTASPGKRCFLSGLGITLISSYP
jgi:hypothetical protein